MGQSGRARNHSPLASRREARVGGGVLCRKCPIHVTTPHYPTHAGRDARGPQIGTYPSHNTAPCRRGRRRSQGPTSTHAGWDARGPQIGTCPHHTTAPCRRGRRRSQGPLPHPCGQGCPRTTNRHRPQPHHCPMPARAPALPGTTTPPMRAGMPADHRSGPAPATPLPHAGEGDPRDPHQPTSTHRRSAWTEKQSQAGGVTRCRTIRGRWPGPGQGW